jgi:integrase
VKLHWVSFFNDRKLNTITLQDLKDFSQQVYDKGLAAGTINHILNVGTKALREAYRKKIIPYDPTEGLISFSGKTKKRGVLTQEEAAELFALEWEDKRAYAGNLLACTTGLRSGEVLAVRKSDIEDNALRVRHSWSRMDRLKGTKTGDERKVPLFPKVREKLLELLAENPHQNDDPFIFHDVLADEPMKPITLVTGLKESCEAIGIHCEKRNIVFHSHRHYYAARMVDKMSAEQVSRITGHKSKAVFEEYAGHVSDANLEAMRTAGSEVFEKIIGFRKGA